MWLRSKQEPVRTSRRRPSRYQPQIEALEDRCLLSAGALDSTFGSGGIVTTAPTRGNDYGQGVLLQPNGDLIAYGVGYEKQGKYSSVSELVRYLPNGSLDASFGSGGIVSNGLDGTLAGALQADGKIVMS